MAKYRYKKSGWIGFDLDGTLSTYDGWVGFSKIGDPIPSMVSVLTFLAHQGYEVRVFTARVAPDPSSKDIDIPARRRVIRAWLDKHVQPNLPKGYPKIRITYQKDSRMKTFYDDRARQVTHNTGYPVEDLLISLISSITACQRDNFSEESRKELLRKGKSFSSYLVESVDPKKRNVCQEDQSVWPSAEGLHE